MKFAPKTEPDVEEPEKLIGGAALEGIDDLIADELEKDNQVMQVEVNDQDDIDKAEA